MSIEERRHGGELSDAASRSPRSPVVLPAELTGFLSDQQFAALFQRSDIGTLVVIKVPTQELTTLRGLIPIGLVHELYADHRSPVIRSLVTLVDQPDAPLRLETFTNIDDPEQRAVFASFASQVEIPFLFYDERVQHRLSKRIRNTAADQIPALLATAVQLLDAIPSSERDFEVARAAVMEATSL